MILIPSDLNKNERIDATPYLLLYPLVSDSETINTSKKKDILFRIAIFKWFMYILQLDFYSEIAAGYPIRRAILRSPPLTLGSFL